MLGAFSIAWVWLMISRYRLARLESAGEEAAPEPAGQPHGRGSRAMTASHDVVFVVAAMA
jgi:hypothetical protein